MRIEHIAIWTNDLERLKTFYQTYFHVSAGEKYTNPVKKFTSYFLNFESGCRLEIMQMPGINPHDQDSLKQFIGLTHFAISVGSMDRVNELTEQFRKDGIIVASEPRRTGDGYYESVVLDPDGNQLEITI
ncbi:MAG TPA: VOC family protein [Ohtaekwangia sp.]|nr:VOC family protein [Ohtaekwangia sp.]